MDEVGRGGDIPPPTFRRDALAKIAHHRAAPYLGHVIKAIGAEQDTPPPEPSGFESASSSYPSHSPTAAPPVEGLSHHEKSNLSPDKPEAGHPNSEILNPNSEIPLLTPEEKRRILARIVRVNPLDCFDESGAFDIARAKRILPPGAIRHIAVHETTRLNAEGQPVTERRINVRLGDPVRALRLDDQLERRRERTLPVQFPIPIQIPLRLIPRVPNTLTISSGKTPSLWTRPIVPSPN